MSLLSQITRLARHSAIYAISTAVQKLPGLLLLPIYTNTVYIPSRSEFGDYIMVFTFIAFMNFFYTYGMDSALMRFFFLGDRDRKTVFSSTIIVLLITSVMSSALLLLFSPPLARLLFQSDGYTVYIQDAAVILIFDALGNLPYLILRAEEKPLQFTLFRGTRFLLEFGFNILFIVVLREGVVGILYATMAAAITNFLLMLPITLRYFSPRVDFPLVREMLAFGLPFLPHGIAFTTIEMVDRLIIPEILGKDALGVYGANYKFGAALSLLINAFRNAWQPFFLRIAKQPDARQVYARVLTYFLCVAGLVVLAGAFFIRDILTTSLPGDFTILGAAYWDGIRIIPVILLSYCFYGIYIILTPAFYIEKKSKYMILFTGSGALVNVAANIVLLTLMQDIMGAALGTLASYITMALTIYIISQRVYPMAIEWGRAARVFFLIFLMLAIAYLVALPFAARLALMTLAAVYLWLAVLDAEERLAAKSRLINILGRGNRP